MSETTLQVNPGTWSMCGRTGVNLTVLALLEGLALWVMAAPAAAEQRGVTVEAGRGKPEVFVQKGHNWAVMSVAFSPNGKLLASGQGEGTNIVL